MSYLDLSRLLPEGIAGLSAYHPPGGGECRVRLDANESPFSTDPLIKDEIARALTGISINRYPDPASRTLRNAFARRFDCPVENVMAGNGSDELIGLLLWTLRGNRKEGTPVITIPAPTFAMYSIAALAAGYQVLEVPLSRELEPDMEEMLRAIREKKPSILFLSSPNNPTGTIFSREQVRGFLEASTGLVVVDEAYGDFSGEASWVPETASYANLAVLRTLSKVGAAGIRCGFLVSGSDLLREVNKVRSPFNVSRYTQVVGEVFLRNYERLLPQISAIMGERDRLSKALQKIGLKVYPSRGNFFLVRCGGKEEQLWGFLHDSGIMVKFLPRLPVTGDVLRITVGTPEENDHLISGSRDFFSDGGADAKG